MGYDDPISTNPAMVLGGLKEGVTPLGWTYAYSTIANDGDRVSGTLAPRPRRQPRRLHPGHRPGRPHDQGRRQRLDPHPGDPRRASPKRRRASSKRWSAAAPAPTPTSAPPASGARPGRPRTTATPGSAAAIEAEVTACVWVGYADTTTPMTTLYNGGPVMGGTFPALIWASVISAWEQIKAERAAEAKEDKESKGESGSSSGSTYGAGIDRPNRKWRNRSAGSERTGRTGSARSPGSGGTAQNRRRPNRANRPRASAARRRRYRRSRRGFETWGLPAAQKRQGRSTALVIPTRGPVTTSPCQSVLGRQEQERVARQVGAVLVEPDAERLGQLARARAEVAVGRGRRGAPASPRARRSAPAPGSAPPPPRPRVRRPTLSRLWIP